MWKVLHCFLENDILGLTLKSTIAAAVVVSTCLSTQLSLSCRSEIDFVTICDATVTPTAVRTRSMSALPPSPSVINSFFIQNFFREPRCDAMRYKNNKFPDHSKWNFMHILLGLIKFKFILQKKLPRLSTRAMTLPTIVPIQRNKMNCKSLNAVVKVPIVFIYGKNDEYLLELFQKHIRKRNAEKCMKSILTVESVLPVSFLLLSLFIPPSFLCSLHFPYSQWFLVLLVRNRNKNTQFDIFTVYFGKVNKMLCVCANHSDEGFTGW